MAKIPSHRHMVIAILILGMALFSPRHLYAAFESDILSPLQNAAGGFPFSVYGNSLSVLSDPNIFTTGGMITIKNFRIEIGYLSYANLGLITYQTGISYSRMP